MGLSRQLPNNLILITDVTHSTSVSIQTLKNLSELTRCRFALPRVSMPETRGRRRFAAQIYWYITFLALICIATPTGRLTFEPVFYQKKNLGA